MFRLLSVASALPQQRKTNDDLSLFLDTSDEWISQRTGIRERAVCVEESLTELLVAAAKEALVRAQLSAQQIDLILCATIRGDYITPSQACVVQKELGASCPAMDIGAACTGFLYALDVAAGYFARKKVKNVLILAGDAMSKLVNWQDRSTCVLFGDAAGAVVLTEGNAVRSLFLSANGNTDFLQIPHVQGNSPFGKPEAAKPPFLQMNGQEVYRFAVSSICKDIRRVCTEAGVEAQQLDWLVPHQANLRIIESAAAKLKIPTERWLTGIEYLGNTSAASIPVVLNHASAKGKLKRGDLLGLSAFGAGLTTGACVLEW